MANKDNSRRRFLKACLPAAATPLLLASAGVATKEKEKSRHPLPPGAISMERFLSKCTACHLCVSHCPSHVIKPSVSENGLIGFMTPVMTFDVHEFCEYECKRCMEVCPADALTDMKMEEKQLAQIGSVHLDIDKCIVIMDDEDCGACAEHCPTQALRMVPYKDGLTQPEIADEEMCIGCGACVSICPELGKAVFIERKDVHSKAKPPTVEEQEEIEIDGFGF